MKYRWSLAPAQPALTHVLAGKLNLSPLLIQCLLNRGISEPDPILRFLQPRLKDLADPFLLPQMRAAVDRLFEAHARQESVLIFGDYDVDGITATALLQQALSRLGWQIQAYLPHRLAEGYGLNPTALENCLAKYPCTLLLAVDCGSTAASTVEWLRERHIDVIILDHHQIGTPPPAAHALVNPRAVTMTSLSADRELAAPQESEPPSPRGVIPFGELCSVGLAFKLAHALVKEGRTRGMPAAAQFDLRPFLDLVALGTIADVVPLQAENRILVSAGLPRLDRTERVGLVALRKAARIEGHIAGYEVGFQLAPRLNAAGRLETATDALQLLMTSDPEEAATLAGRLDGWNRERQEIERKILDEVVTNVRRQFNPASDCVIVEGQSLWHIGVVGIVASRLVQEFHRPAIVLGGEGVEWRGSGRSIEGFDLAAALRECQDLLVRHGGHAMAAGVTLRPENVPAFRDRLNHVAQRALKPEQFQPVLHLDAEVPLSELHIDRLLELSQLEQTGTGNPPVHLCVRGATHHRALQRIGPDRRHAKLWVTDGSAVREALIWGVGDGPLPVGKFDLAVAPQLNRYNGTATVQLKVLDWCAT